RIVDAIAGELYVQMHLGRSGGDDSAKIPFAVVPIRAGPSEKVAEVGAGLIPYPHPAPGQPVMREMQCLQQSRFVAGIQCHHEAVEYRECCAYRSLIPGWASVWSIAMIGASPGGNVSRRPRERCAYSCRRRSFRPPRG